MKAIDAVRIVLKFSDMGMKHLGEMSDAPLLRRGRWGGNHAMWIAGHNDGRFQGFNCQLSSFFRAVPKLPRW